jgi:hypothetical protein
MHIWLVKNFDEAGRHLFLVVIISVGSNAVAAYTRNHHACIRHERFTDNDRDQQTYNAMYLAEKQLIPIL